MQPDAPYLRPAQRQLLKDLAEATHWIVRGGAQRQGGPRVKFDRIEPLHKLGLVARQKQGDNAFVALTDAGRQLLQAERPTRGADGRRPDREAKRNREGQRYSPKQLGWWRT